MPGYYHTISFVSISCSFIFILFTLNYITLCCLAFLTSFNLIKRQKNTCYFTGNIRSHFLSHHDKAEVRLM